MIEVFLYNLFILICEREGIVQESTVVKMYEVILSYQPDGRLVFVEKGREEKTVQAIES